MNSLQHQTTTEVALLYIITVTHPYARSYWSRQTGHMEPIAASIASYHASAGLPLAHTMSLKGEFPLSNLLWGHIKNIPRYTCTVTH